MPTPRAPPIPQGRHPRAVLPTPTNSAGAQPRHQFCAQLTLAGLSFRSPSSHRALHPPASCSLAPWPWHPGGAAARAGCPWGHRADRPQLPRLWSRGGVSVAAQTRPLSAAHPVPRAGAGGSWQSVRLCLFQPSPGAVLCKVRDTPASGTPGWGEVPAPREGGRGRAGGARREGES